MPDYSTFRGLCRLVIPAAAACASAGHAVEGMWMPEQLPEIESQLKAAGMRIDPEQLSDLTAFPMGAVISLGGCTASFVSPHGLVVTNHHCARGSVQFNSSEAHNLLVNGFVARNMADELPAAPGTRVYVTTRVEDVTGKVEAVLNDRMTPRERYQAIEDTHKALIAECEAVDGFRCQVREFFGGASHKLIERLEIRDVRIAYAPGDNIGRYGGDEDNWLWPRHTGDFAFYRAYVGPDGNPADYADDNVAYRPAHFLKVSRAGLDAGDFVMAAGYPGTTRRYARLAEVEHTFDWLYPTWRRLIADWVATIESAAPAGSDARIKYESRLAGLKNFRKNTEGQLAGARRVGLAERRAAREAALAAWAETAGARGRYASIFAEFDALIDEIMAAARQDFWYERATSPQLLATAQRLYRLAVERTKADAEREPGFQDRDMAFFTQRLRVLDRRFDPAVDKAEWLLFLDRYRALPAAQRVAPFDGALGLHELGDREALAARLDGFYAATELGDVAVRLAWLERSVADFAASDDPFIRLAVALHEHEMADQEENKIFDGRRSRIGPAYMEGVIAYSESQGQAVYPDANSTLRVTYGQVYGGSPKDGLIYEAFTRLKGITEKDTGREPFNAPLGQLELIAAKDHGGYELASIGSVPVNFLTDLDSTGGNSGSATLDADGNLVGLLFDGTIESVNSDWDFAPRTTRSIHVDSRYMLWIMEKVDGVAHLVDEMSLTTTR